MNEHQLAILEQAYQATHAADRTRATLAGCGMGALVALAGTASGAANGGAARGEAQRPSVHGATGHTLSVACGRLSYLLGLAGPCNTKRANLGLRFMT